MADGTNETATDLEEQVRRLSAENELLRSEVAAEGPAAAPRRTWRVVLAVLLMALATVLAPAAVVAGWARIQLTSADTFVDTFAPLADDPNVQGLVRDQAVAAINNAVDIPGLTNDVFTGLDQLNLPPRAASALKLLQTPVTEGIQSFINSSISNVVASSAFRDLWRQGLLTAHDGLVGLQGDLDGPNRAVTVSDTGEIGVQLQPIIAAVKARLVARGVGFAANIPDINKVIVVAKTDAVPKIRTAYALAVGAGTWLPFVVLALFVGAVFAAMQRRRAVVIAAICLAAAMLVTALALGVGRIFVTNAVSPDLIPAAAADAIYTQSLTLLRSSVLAIGALAVFVAVVAWFAGPRGQAARLRRLVVDGATASRQAAEARGVTTGRIGEWIGSQARTIRVVIAVLAAAVILLLRPLSFSDVVWVAVIAVVAVLLVLFLGRPRAEVMPGLPGRGRSRIPRFRRS
ncbi:MAG TPA: hypothetical protein VNC14_11355 [Lapillicoccus sp.]|jgi:hypothetical protein|nr:hypothetical protein [Lapillicoccus sp.]